MLVGVFLLLSRMLWDRCIATSSRHNAPINVNPHLPNRGQVGELTTGNGNSPTSGCQFSPDSYLGESTLDVNSPTL